MYRDFKFAAAILLVQSFGGNAAVEYPSAEISNGTVRAQVYLPDAHGGFYQGTRFDWSGVIYSLQANGHNYYGPWFNKTDPSVHDFVYRGSDIVAGPCSAITGPVDEFAPLGYGEAKTGGSFVKIGVGALRKPDESPYDNYRVYEIANGGKWTIQKHSDELHFTQRLEDGASGYAYTYEKAIRLPHGKSEMVLLHRLKNTGKKLIQTNVYNHNFLVLDGRATGPDFTIKLPFAIQSTPPSKVELAKIEGKQLTYSKQLEGEETVATPLGGFGSDASDTQVHIENAKAGVGITWHTDRPLLKESLWSIRSVIAVEPFIQISVEPGAEFTWQTSYEYYKLP